MNATDAAWGNVRRTLAAGLIAVVAAAGAACSGGADLSPTGPSASRAGTVTAHIDGVAWSARSVARARFGSGSTAGLLRVEGAREGMALNFYFAATAPGTYPIRTAALIDGDASFVLGGSFSGDGSAGSVNITALSAVRVAGTFQFTAVQGSTGARRVIANGHFDVPIE